jgi:putative ABC transport system permease protein
MRWCAALLSRGRVERDLAAELQFHIDQQVEENIVAGMDATTARRAALRALGGIAQTKDKCRDALWLTAFNVIEIRGLFRMMWRNRASSAAAIFMVATSAAVATTTFALADAALWRALPYRDASRLAMIITTHENGEAAVSLPDFHILRDKLTQARVAGAGSFAIEYALAGFGDPRQLRGRLSTAGFFDVLGVRMVAGRNFTRGEEKPGNNVVILSERLWNELFGRKPEAIGSVLGLNGGAYTVVGVVAQHRDSFGDIDVYVPMQFSPSLQRGLRLLSTVARMTDTATLAQLQTEVRTFTANTGDPLATGYTVEAVDYHVRAGSRVRSAVYFLFAGGVGLALMAFFNYAILTTARTHQGLGELTLRLALGATKMRVLALAATEAVVLGIAAAAVAGGIAWLILPILQTRYGTDILNEVSLGVRPLLFLGVVIALSVLVAIAAASRAFSSRLSDARGVATSRLVVGRTLVSVQVGLSLVLVTSAVLFVRSFGELNRVDPGFKADGLYASRIALPALRFQGPKSTAFYKALLERLKQDGVTAALSSNLPLSGVENPTSFIAQMSNGEKIPIQIRSVSPEYLDVLGVAVESGRSFARTDSAQAPRVVVINEHLGKQVARLGNPLGQMRAFDFVEPPYVAQVVGVVADIRHNSLSQSGTAEAYFPYEQTPQTRFSLVMSGPANSRDAARALRTAMNSVDPAQAFSAVVPTADYVQQNLAQPRVEAQLVGSFAAVALVIAASGLYSLLSFLVSGSRREWAVRLALGASHRHLLRLVFGQSATYAAVGVVIGLALLFLAKSMISSLVYGVSVWDPYIVIGCTAVIVLVCLLSATIPAFRAGRISAAESLANTP